MEFTLALEFTFSSQLLSIWTHFFHRHLRIEVSKNCCFRNTCRKCFLHFLFLLRCIWPVKHSVRDRIDHSGQYKTHRLQSGTDSSTSPLSGLTHCSLIERIQVIRPLCTVTHFDSSGDLLITGIIYCVRHHCFLSISIQPQQNLFFSPKRKFCTNHSI